MIKIGILTYWFATNYGAVLQAYALKKKLNSIDNVYAEIIMYKPYGYKDIPNTESELINRKYKQKREYFDTFLIEEMDCHLEQIDYKLEDNKYDFYCVGSDQVWNMEFNFWSEIYLLDAIQDNSKKISYAASIGLNVTDASFNKTVFERYIRDFHAVSIREIEQVAYIKSLEVNCCRALDPVLLLDKSEYENIISKSLLYDGEYILFFCIDEDNVLTGVEFVNYLSQKHNLPIIHSFVETNYYLFSRNAGSMFFSSIGEFLWYVKNARLVVTNSYHCVLFSMIFEKDFYILNNRPQMETRFSNLKTLFPIEQREVKNNNINRKQCEPLDYKKIKYTIESERIISEEYIVNMLVR